MGVGPAGNNDFRGGIYLLRRIGSDEATHSTRCWPCDIIWHTHILFVPPALALVDNAGIASGRCAEAPAGGLHTTTMVEVLVFCPCMLGFTLRSQLQADGGALSMALPDASVDRQVFRHSP